jgi:hypothetical protein
VFFFLSDPNGVWRFYLVKKESLKSEREQQIYELLLCMKLSSNRRHDNFKSSDQEINSGEAVGRKGWLHRFGIWKTTASVV